MLESQKYLDTYKVFYIIFLKKKKLVFSSKNMVIFEQSVGFLAKYYFGKKLSSNIIL